MTTLDEFVYDKALGENKKKPRTRAKKKEEEDEFLNKLNLLETRFILSRTRTNPEDEKIEGDNLTWRQKPRGEWNAGDLLESWKEDARICQKQSCPVRAFRPEPFTVDTSIDGRFQSFTFEYKKESHKEFIVLSCKRANADLVEAQKSLSEQVTKRATLLDVIEHVLWPLIGKLD